MKKLGKIILIIMVLVLLSGAAYGGYYLYNKNEESNKKISELENKISKIENDKTTDENKISKIENDKTTDENKISQNHTTNKTENTYSNSNDSKYVEEYTKIIDNVEKNEKNSDIKCDLIYFNNDDIPDLVIGVSGYWVSLYMYENGTVYNLMENESYGIGGCKYYDYLEKKGATYTYGNDYAGAIGTTTISILNSKKEFDTLSVTDEGAEIEKTNPNYEEIMKALEEEKGWYYNGKKISEQEFNNKLKEFSVSINEEDYKDLKAERTPEEVKKELQQ